MEGYVMRMMVLLLLVLLMLVLLVLLMFQRLRFSFPISSRWFCKGNSSKPHHLSHEAFAIASRDFRWKNYAIAVYILAIAVGVLIMSFVFGTHNSKIPVPPALGITNKRDQAHVTNPF
jgi:hypothetical protein